MQISDGWKLSEEYIVYFTLLIGECTQQLSARRYHKIIMCTKLMHVYMYVFMYVYTGLFLPKQPTTKVRWSTSKLKSTQNCCWHSCSCPPIQMGFSLDERSSNHPVILEQPWCPICLMIVSQPQEHGATMVHGIGQTQVIVQHVEDMRQSVEKMVRIKQTLIS